MRLATSSAGAGGRPLLLVHGFGGAKEDFGDWLEPLAQRGWHAVAPDLRGHGQSAKPDDEAAYDWPLFVADVVELVDGLGWERFVVLGHSMGGMVVQHLVLDHPSRVAALVLMNTSHAAPDGLDPELVDLAVTVIREQGVDTYLALAQELEERDPLASPAHKRVVAERPGYAEFCDAKARGAAPAMRLAMMPRFLSQPDRLAALASVAVPTLVIDGEQDAAMRAHGERMAKTIPGARRVVVPDAGHSPQFENPPVWWDAVSGFLDSLDSLP
jgi:3-oxoadipate enol-lactonase